MSLPNYLSKIKSSGIYRFVWDKSEIAGVDAEILRLVVGYSEKGPFNTPIYVKSASEFKNIFGDISKKLEKRGIFFHRLALQALTAGPILVLNLKKFGTEKVEGSAFDVYSKADKITPIKVSVEDVYDVARFWKLSPEDAHKAILSAAKKTSAYVSVVATDSKDASCSIIIRGYHPNGYDVTLTNWYAAQNEEMPEYLEPYANMLASDFFAEVYVFKGQFTADICTADPLNQYFDIDKDGKPVLKEYVLNAFGEKVDTLPLLANDSASNFVNSYSGCLLPYFKGSNGSYISLDLLFNADNYLHKMMMYLDSDSLYNGTITADNIATTCWEDGKNYALGTSLKKTEKVLDPLVNLTPVYDDGENVIIGYKYNDYSYSDKSGHDATCFEPDFYSYKIDATAYKFINLSGYIYYIASADGADVTVYKAADASRCFIDLDVIYSKDSKFYSDEACTEEITAPTVLSDVSAYKFTKEGEDTLYGYKADDSSYITVGKKAVPADYDAEVIEYTAPDKPTVPEFDRLGLNVGDRVIVSNVIYTISSIEAGSLVCYDYEGNKKEITDGNFKLCNHSCSINNANLAPVYFAGYTYENASPASLSMKAKLDWQKTILSTLTTYDGIRLALTNRTDIDYRYIVDTFESFPDAEVHKELALICKEKDNALGFLNFPSAKTFKDCDYTKFTDANNKFQVKYIAQGGNKQKNPGVLFSLVSEPNGASFVSYNTPLTFSDGTVNTYVPSAALVSNNFMEKYLSRQPYYIVAGPTYGRMIYTGLIGPDFNYSRADLDILEPFGVNAMVYVPRLGTYINSNKTAKQNPQTALSLVNVRELVIYLQDEIEKLLQDYQWEFNTQELRDKIKAKADSICERVKNNNGIYEYLNVCDESNNTDDVIDNEMFVLSTSIEPAKGAGKMVQELTLYKKGGMKSIIK